MRRTNLPAVAFAVVSFALGLRLLAAPAKPGSSASLWDQQAQQLCDGNQLKPSVTNPTCQGWIINNFTNRGSAEAVFYHNNYPDACTQDSTGAVYCAFPGADTACTSFDTVASCQAKQANNLLNARAACKAYADAVGSLATDIPSNKKPYCGTGAPGNPGYFRCAWCQKGEAGCAPTGNPPKGKYIPGEVCRSGDVPFPYDTVPAAAQTPYCSTPMSGPYRNHPDSYQACGTTQTQTYAGMVFTLDQTKQIRNFNKAANGGVLKSDLRGFCYPRTGKARCAKSKRGNPDICIEPDVLNESTGSQNSAQVHHIVPKKDRRGCPCGANTNKNAAVISQRLNAYFTNRNRNGFVSLCSPTITEVDWLNNAAPE